MDDEDDDDEDSDDDDYDLPPDALDYALGEDMSDDLDTGNMSEPRFQIVAMLSARRKTGTCHRPDDYRNIGLAT